MGYFLLGLRLWRMGLKFVLLLGLGLRLAYLLRFFRLLFYLLFSFLFFYLFST